MTHVSDNIFLGAFLSGGLVGVTFAKGASDPIPPGGLLIVPDPTLNQGIGPAGRLFQYIVTPLTASNTNVATAQHTTQNVGLALTAGTGITAEPAPDGSGATVYAFDCPRCLALTSTGNMSAATFTVTGYDFLGRKTTQALAGPNAGTVYTLKSFTSILSIVSNTTDGVNNISAGTSDIFGLPWYLPDAGSVVSNKWAGNLGSDTGTFTAGDFTSPATSSTGDPRGTYEPSTSSNGSRRLVLTATLAGNACGSTATLVNAIGQTPA